MRERNPKWDDEIERARAGVTICIAAACGTATDQQIVLCTDRRVSSALGNAETSLKQRPVSASFVLLTAGREDDIEALVNSLRARFLKLPKGFTEADVGLAVDAALADRKRQKVNQYVQSRYALSYAEFVAMGKDKFPPDLFRNAIEKIRDIGLGAEGVIAGFVGQFPLLIEITPSFEASTRSNFAVAGAGAHLATSVLMQREQADISDVGRAVYVVYEAKKLAQNEVSVGDQTMLSMMRADGSTWLLNAQGEIELSKLYRQYGPQLLPAELPNAQTRWQKLA